jgi:hypothetical protein
MADYPIFINCRDRVSGLRALVDWLERAGCTRIHLVDNESTYPPLLEYFASTPHTVIRLGRNQGHRAVWESGAVQEHAAGEYYVATDDDIVPVEECPQDALDHFRRLLDRHPDRAKVGFGLRIDDLPRHYRFARQVRDWEAQFWTAPVEPAVFDAPIDTTFALHRPGTDFADPELRPHTVRSLRTGPPYVARHMAWYVDSRHLDEEERYYRERARTDVTHWNVDRLPERLVAGLRSARRPAGDPPLWRRLLRRPRSGT